MQLGAPVQLDTRPQEAREEGKRVANHHREVVASGIGELLAELAHDWTDEGRAGGGPDIIYVSVMQAILRHGHILLLTLKMNADGKAIIDGLVRGQTSWDHTWAARDGVHFLHDQGLPCNLADAHIADYLHYRSSVDPAGLQHADTTRPGVEALCSNIRDSAHSGRHSCTGEFMEFMHARAHGHFAVPGQSCTTTISTPHHEHYEQAQKLYLTHCSVPQSTSCAVICKCLKCNRELEKPVPERGQKPYFYPLFEKGRRGTLYMKLCQHCR